ncbi:conserved membrane hypothetical protein [Arthrobacter sp. 9V]|nr:conserved membrane hypothetical protein [Arthrobacter sp. 9V]
MLAMGVPVVLQIILPVGTYFALSAESPSYSFAAQTVFLAPTGACWLAAVLCGLTCLRLARRSGADGQRTTAWTFGVLGLCVAGLEGLMLLVPFLYS